MFPDPQPATMTPPLIAQDNRQRLLFTAAIWLCPMQSMLLLGGAPYISPPTGLLAMLGLLLGSLGYRPRAAHPSTSSGGIRKAVHVFCFYALVHGIFVDLIRQANGGSSVLGGEYLRQAMALVSGLFMFEYFRLMLVARGLPWVTRGLALSIRPHVVLGCLSAVGLVLGLAPLDDAITALRSILIPTAEAAQNFRATGLATEPSYFAIILAAIFIPMIWMDAANCKRPVQWLWIGMSVCAVLFTFSLTGFMAIAVGAVYWVLRYSKNPLLLPTMLVAAVLGLVTISKLDGNYAARQLNGALNFASSDQATGSLSLLDSWYSYAGPISNYSIRLAAGIGLGGTETAINDILTENVADLLREAFGKDRIGVLMARVWVEQGAIGLILFLTVWVAAWKSIGNADITAVAQRVLKSAVAILIAGYTVKLGSFSLPYMWILLAYVSVLPVKQAKTIATFIDAGRPS